MPCKYVLLALQQIFHNGVSDRRHTLDLYPSSFVVYPNVDPRDEAKVLDLFGLSGSEEDPYDKAVLALNETGTAKDGRPNTEPLRIKLRDFRRGISVSSPLLSARFCSYALSFHYRQVSDEHDSTDLGARVSTSRVGIRQAGWSSDGHLVLSDEGQCYHLR